MYSFCLRKNDEFGIEEFNMDNVKEVVEKDEEPGEYIGWKNEQVISLK